MRRMRVRGLRGWRLRAANSLGASQARSASRRSERLVVRPWACSSRWSWLTVWQPSCQRAWR